MIGDSPTGIEKRLTELSQTVVDELGYELYDVEYVKGSKTLRVYIADKETGSAVIEDCVAVDRGFTEHVENADWIPDDFVLEVSSPGVYRNLKSASHFDSAKGEVIQLELMTKLKGEELPKKYQGAKKLRGVLTDYDDKNIILDADGNELRIEVGNVKKANLDPDL